MNTKTKNRLAEFRFIQGALVPRPPSKAELKESGKPKRQSKPVRRRRYVNDVARGNLMACVRCVKNAATRDWLQDMFVREHIDEELLEIDRTDSDLDKARFRNYGNMHELEASQYFAFEYHGAAFDKKGRQVKLLPSPPIRLESHSVHGMNCIWRARQAADRLGMKYDEYIAAVVAGHKKNLPNRAFLPRDLCSKAAVAYAKAKAGKKT
ncbi:hypothetical protein [Lysobacter terrae]